MKMRLTYQLGVLIILVYTGMLMYVVYHIHMYDICMHFDIIITYIHVYIDMNIRAQTHARTQMRISMYVYLFS